MALWKQPSLGKALPFALLALAAAGVLLLSMLVRDPEEKSTPVVKPAKSNIGVVRLDPKSGDSLLDKEAELKDPSPLFLPTEWNSAFRANPEKGLRKPGEGFGDFPPKYVFVGNNTPVSLPPSVEVPSAPALALNHLASDRPFPSFGYQEPHPLQLQRERLLLELSRPLSGEKLLQLELPLTDWPKVRPWQPGEFLVRSSAMGLVGRPCLVVSTGVEEVDLYLEQVIRGVWVKLSVSGRLSPGTYQLKIGE